MPLDNKLSDYNIGDLFFDKFLKLFKPKYRRIVGYVVAFFVAAGLIGWPYINKPDIQEGPEVLGVTIQKDIQSDFSDKNNWENLEKFIVISEDPFIIGLGTESRGNIAFYKKNLSSRFAADFKFIPKGEDKTNVVFQFDGLYRVIIGDGDNKSIKLEKNLDPDSVPANWVVEKDLERNLEKRFIGGLGFLTNYEVEFQLTSIPLDNHKLKLEIVLTYKPLVNSLGGAEQTAQFAYILDTLNPTSSLVGRLGVGLLDDSLSGEVKVQPVELSAEKYDLD